MSDIAEICRLAEREKGRTLGRRGRLTPEERKELVLAYRLANMSIIH